MLIFILGGALLFVIALWLLLHLLLRRPGEVNVVAHRGAAAVAPENTLPAIAAGMKSGAQYLEVDVQRCADGELVIIHDLTVDRTSDGSGRVAEQSFQQLKALDAGGWFSPEFKGAQIPTLRQVFDTLESWPGALALEVKSPGRYPGIAQDLQRAIHESGFRRLSVLSFDHRWLAQFKQLEPEIPITALSVFPLQLTQEMKADRLGVNWLAPVLDPTLIFRCHRRGQEIWVWTVDDPWQQRLMRWLGVDGITANNPMLAVSTLSPAPNAVE